MRSNRRWQAIRHIQKHEFQIIISLYELQPLRHVNEVILTLNLWIQTVKGMGMGKWPRQMILNDLVRGDPGLFQRNILSFGWKKLRKTINILKNDNTCCRAFGMLVTNEIAWEKVNWLCLFKFQSKTAEAKTCKIKPAIIWMRARN